MSDERKFRRYNPFPRRLRDCLQPALKASGKGRGFADHRLMLDWEKIVGPELSAQCIPLKISMARQGAEATLTLQVSPGHALLVQHQEPLLLERITQHFGYRAVSRILLVQAPLPVARTVPHMTAPNGQTPPHLASMLSGITDDSLRTALSSLAAALAGRDRKA